MVVKLRAAKCFCLSSKEAEFQAFESNRKIRPAESSWLRGPPHLSGRLPQRPARASTKSPRLVDRFDGACPTA